jgi:hypothetical protein
MILQPGHPNERCGRNLSQEGHHVGNTEMIGSEMMVTRSEFTEKQRRY